MYLSYFYVLWVDFCRFGHMFSIFCFRYDPLAGLPTDTDTEQDRVIFIKSIAQFMVCIYYTCIMLYAYLVGK